ncbi:phytochelatin synthase family protein [Shewanella nanhaiensis]|uniref:glutathione gamma-glutamylcysteinyltransferase n=1 Tax=Shewanella nanhaiensis TaxID=2864872 RepID=A0ABS7E1Q8_9GAMM|nr:phytochelatin synthase family protein [Shewanella nanhaiensis]MBW8183490.1 phytochelatin synthase family protein [Shewanella nanhaiensis]
MPQNKRLLMAGSILIYLLFQLCQPPAFACELLDWSSTEGSKRLSSASLKQDLFKLAPQFEGQSNKTFCGVTSMVIVANALRVSPNGTSIPLDSSRLGPDESRYFPKGVSPLFHRYTQESILEGSDKTRAQILGEPKVKGGESDYGMQLSEITSLAKRLAFTAKPTYVQPEKLDDANYLLSVKQALKQALKRDESYVIINYSRSALNQAGSGHFSPLAAFDRGSDSFLIMDVSNTYQTWVWVSSKRLINAMATLDIDKPRGFVEISQS